MKHRKFIRLLVIPAALFIALLTVLVMCHRSAICGETYSDRANYAKALGYSISADSETVQNIVIPAVFGSVYENYNALQKQCGFDLSLYKGEDAVQYTYIITDYTDDSTGSTAGTSNTSYAVSADYTGSDSAGNTDSTGNISADNRAYIFLGRACECSHDADG